MGKLFLDQYSLLHFAAGVVGYFFKIPLLIWIALNFLFEVIENSKVGMALINELPIWPGEKRFADSALNIAGDILSATLGWIVAYYLDYLGNKYKWFDINGDIN